MMNRDCLSAKETSENPGTAAKPRVAFCFFGRAAAHDALVEGFTATYCNPSKTVRVHLARVLAEIKKVPRRNGANGNGRLA
jgi:hypothetical protein